MTKRLTLELGIRFTHFQPWVDRTWERLSRSLTTAHYNPSCTPTAILRVRMAQARPQRSAGRIPDARLVLPAALRSRVRSDGHRQDRAARRMGPLLLPLGPVHHRPGCVGGRADTSRLARPTSRHRRILYAKQLDTLNFAQRSRCPRRRWTARTTSSLTRTARTSRYRSARRGPACWRWPTWAIGAAICQTTATALAATSTWFRWGPCCRRRTAASIRTTLTANNFRPLLGFCGPGPGDQ